jgi:hypothetical protein
MFVRGNTFRKRIFSSEPTIAVRTHTLHRYIQFQYPFSRTFIAYMYMTKKRETTGERAFFVLVSRMKEREREGKNLFHNLRSSRFVGRERERETTTSREFYART